MIALLRYYPFVRNHPARIVHHDDFAAQRVITFQ